MFKGGMYDFLLDGFYGAKFGADFSRSGHLVRYFPFDASLVNFLYRPACFCDTKWLHFTRTRMKYFANLVYF